MGLHFTVGGNVCLYNGASVICEEQQGDSDECERAAAQRRTQAACSAWYVTLHSRYISPSLCVDACVRACVCVCVCVKIHGMI